MSDLTTAMLAFMPKCCTPTKQDGDYHYGYIIESGNLVKIGTSTNPVSRLCNLQASSAIAMTPLAFGRGDDVEEFLHLRFRQSRQHGEWFTASAVKAWLASKPASFCIACFDRRSPTHRGDPARFQLSLPKPRSRRGKVGQP